MSSDDYPIDWIGPRAVVRMPAEIDVLNADEAGAALLAAASQGPAVLIVDMSATTFCDSAGVRAIVVAYRHAAAAGIQLKLVATAVERILTLAGLRDLVPIDSTLEAALATTAPPD